jgi:acyl-CoA thioesterase
MDIEDVEPGHAIARLEVTESLLNPNGAVHGGVLFTMVDTAMGKATMSVLAEGQLCASIEVQMRFLRPVSRGRLEADAAVIRRGRKIIHLEARVRDRDGVLVATGAGTFAVVT